MFVPEGIGVALEECQEDAKTQHLLKDFKKFSPEAFLLCRIPSRHVKRFKDNYSVKIRKSISAFITGHAIEL